MKNTLGQKCEKKVHTGHFLSAFIHKLGSALTPHKSPNRCTALLNLGSFTMINHVVIQNYD